MSLDAAKEQLERLLNESYQKLSRVQGEIIEAYVRRRNDYESEVKWWGSINRKSKQKALPYETQHDIDRLAEMSNKLYRESMTGQSIIEHLVSFVVGEGHTYKVTARRGQKVSAEEIDEIVGYIEDYTGEVDWQEFQEESVRRYFRNGDRFRRLFVTDDEYMPVVVRFAEPWEIRNPEFLTDRDDIVSNFGIVTQRHDARTVVGYWVDGEDDMVPAWQMQHAKYGVDANDPRGIPLLWVAHCALKRIAELSQAIHEIAVLQTSIALIITTEHSARAITDRINNLVRKVSGELYEEDGRPRLGNTLAVAGGENFEFPAPRVNIENLVAGIRKDQRFIGNLIGMPDWMVSGDTSVSNFSSSVTSEGPFAKRIRREQRRQGSQDIDLLWRVIASRKGASLGEADAQRMARDLRERIIIDAVGPLITERNIREMVSAVREKVEAGFQSLQGACAELGGDFARIMEERRQEEELGLLNVMLPLAQMTLGGLDDDDTDGAGQNLPGSKIRRDRESGNNPARGDAPDPQRDTGRPRHEA